jgi:EmrB/QacA subfamily drug resistance transporter
MAQTLNGASIAHHAPQSLHATVSRQRLALILIGVMLGMLLSALDQTVVGTALPHIVAQLGGLDQYSWVVTAYLLASTVSIPLYGKLSDLYGRRLFFISGMVIFLVGSALSGTSQNMTQLIIYRGLQGLGAGGMMPLAQAIIGDIFPPAERGKWQGLIMAVFGLATIIGPLLGGWITDHWSWHWVFYVNMPVGAVAILTAGLVLPRQRHRVKHTIDYLGSITLIAWAVPLLLAFSWAGTQYAWGSWQIVGLLPVRIPASRTDHQPAPVQKQHLPGFKRRHVPAQRGHVRRDPVPAPVCSGGQRPKRHQLRRDSDADDAGVHVQ